MEKSDQARDHFGCPKGVCSIGQFCVSYQTKLSGLAASILRRRMLLLFMVLFYFLLSWLKAWKSEPPTMNKSNRRKLNGSNGPALIAAFTTSDCLQETVVFVFNICCGSHYSRQLN